MATVDKIDAEAQQLSDDSTHSGASTKSQSSDGEADVDSGIRQSAALEIECTSAELDDLEVGGMQGGSCSSDAEPTRDKVVDAARAQKNSDGDVSAAQVDISRISEECWQRSPPAVSEAMPQFCDDNSLRTKWSNGVATIMVKRRNSKVKSGLQSSEKSCLRSCQYFTSALCGLSLGNAGLGGCLRLFLTAEGDAFAQLGQILQLVLSAIALLPLFMFLLKVALFPGQVAQDLTDVRPTCALHSSGAMALASLSRAIYDLSSEAGVAIWYAGLFLHLVLMINFFYQRISQWATWKWTHCTPAWFVTTVGICNFAANSGGMQTVWQPAVQLSLYLGIAWLFTMLPLIAYRLLRYDSMDPSFYPSLCIFMAPSSLCTAGWLTVYPTATFHGMTLCLLALSVLTAIVVYGCMRYLTIALPVMPGWASYTFPTVIFAVALKRYSLACDDGTDMKLVFQYAAWIACAFASFMVMIVDINYVRMLVFGTLTKAYTVEKVEKKPLRLLVSQSCSAVFTAI